MIRINCDRCLSRRGRRESTVRVDSLHRREWSVTHSLSSGQRQTSEDPAMTRTASGWVERSNNHPVIDVEPPQRRCRFSGSHLGLFRAPDGTPFVTPILSPDPWYRISSTVSLSAAWYSIDIYCAGHSSSGYPAILLPFSILLPLFLSVFLAFANFLSSFALLWCPFTSPRCVISRRNHSHSDIWYSSLAIYRRVYPSRNILYVTFNFEVHRNKRSYCSLLEYLCLFEMYVFAW